MLRGAERCVELCRCRRVLAPLVRTAFQCGQFRSLVGRRRHHAQAGAELFALVLVLPGQVGGVVKLRECGIEVARGHALESANEQVVVELAPDRRFALGSEHARELVHRTA